MRNIFIILSVCLLLMPTTLMGQIYPIRTQTSIASPVPSSLEEMVTTAGKTTLSIWVEDAEVVNYAVKLKLNIEANGIRIYTKPHYFQQAIYLNGGETQYFDGIDLKAWFDVDNLVFEGLTKNEYLSNNRLEEGTYRIWFDVIDYYRDVTVSSAISSIAMIYLTSEPTLTFPADQKELDYSSTQNIYFGWIQQASVNPATQQEFVFELWQVLPKDRDPYEIVGSTLPMYKTITRQSSFLYDASMPTLVAGQYYCWRVTVYDAYRQESFSNDGVSEVYSFRYGKSCESPELDIDLVDETSFRLSWLPNVYAENYLVHIKSKSDENWETYETCNVNYTASDLNPYQTYQARVTAVCYEESSDSSELVEYSTGLKVNYECGQLGDPMIFESYEPLKSLRVGEYFTAYYFWIKTTKVEGSNGKFSGEGYVTVPYLGKLGFLVEFKDISLNENRTMTDGVVQFVKGEDNSLMLDVGDLFHRDISPEDAIDYLTEADSTSYTIGGDIASVEVYDNTITITQDDGKVTTYTLNDEDLVTIVGTDDDEAYVVDAASGSVYSGTTNTNGITGSDADSTYIITSTSSGCTVSFSQHKKQKYGYDALGSSINQPEAYFNVGSNNLRVDWKALKQGTADYVLASLSGETDSVSYGMQSGMIALKEKTNDNDTVNILLTGTYDGHEDVLQAFTPKYINDSTVEKQIEGELGVVTYEGIIANVVLVPVNDAVVPNPTFVQTELNKIYSNAIVSWHVSGCDDTLSVPEIANRKFVDTGANKLSPYTTDMKAVRTAFKKQASIDKNTLYLFFVENNESDMLGYMPINYQYGFIFTTNTNSDKIIKTIAHELGHGAFNLVHTFSNDSQYNITQGQSSNLMDYTAGTDLWKYQWDLIHDPQTMLFAWAQDEEEGAMVTTDDIKLQISETAKELSQKIGSDIYMVIHIATCNELTVPIDKKLNAFTRTYDEGVTPQLITIKSEDKKIYTVLYYSLKEGFSTEFSSLLQSADEVNLQGVTKSSFLGYSAAPFDKVIECTNNLDGLGMYACTANDPNFLGFDTEERTVLYVDLLLTSIKACLEEQKNDKVGDQFYREFASKATTEQETKQIRQIADVFNKIGDALLQNNNTEGWAENGDYFRSSYEAYKQLGYSFDEYLAKITSYLNQYEQQKAFLEKLTDNESIAIAINAFSDKEIEYLPLTLRVRCIGNLTSERMRGNINLFGSDEEYAVLRMLKYLPEKEIKDLIGNLKNNALLERLDSEYDDLEFFAGDENYGKLIDVLDKYALSANNVTEANKATTLETLYNQNRIYNITGGKVGEKYVSASKISSNGEIGITISSFEGYTEPVNTGMYQGFPMPIIKSQPPVNISFDSPVAVYHNDYLKGVDANKEGQLEVVSTLKLHYYLSCNKDENIKTTISVVIDVGSLAIGGAGIVSGSLKGVKLILAVCDVASSVTSLATTAMEDKIMSKYGSDGQKYINSMRAVSAVLGFADLGGQGVLKFKSMLKDDLVTIGKFYPKLANDLEAKDLYQQSKKLIDDVTDYDDEIARLIDNAGDLGSAFTYDITKVADHIKAAIRSRGYVDADIEELIKINQLAAYGNATEAQLLKARKIAEECFGMPTAATKMRKVLPIEDVNAYHLGNANISSQQKMVGGFVAKVEDVEVKNAEQMFNDLRLDYDGTKFSKDKGFATIEYDNVGDVVRPYNSKNAPTFGPPNTLTGMTGSYEKIIPEFCIDDRVPLVDGAILQLFDKEGKVLETYELEDMVWIKQ